MTAITRWQQGSSVGAISYVSLRMTLAIDISSPPGRTKQVHCVIQKRNSAGVACFVITHMTFQLQMAPWTCCVWNRGTAVHTTVVLCRLWKFFSSNARMSSVPATVYHRADTFYVFYHSAFPRMHANWVVLIFNSRPQCEMEKKTKRNTLALFRSS